MQNLEQGCPIWGLSHQASGTRRPTLGIIDVFNSPRTGGAYQVQYEVEDDLAQLASFEKAFLTSWLIDQRMYSVEPPVITKAVVERAKTKRPLPAHERADRLLRLISRMTLTVGRPVEIRAEDPVALAWSESTEWSEIDFYLRYLEEEGFIKATFFAGRNFSTMVTVDGYERIADQAANVDSAQAFVAMWFDDSMLEAWNDGIEAGIRDAGFNPLRIDRKDHINKIEDEIIAEIRRSRFVVADFTQGTDGARGGVYYEAGFAHGLDLPVIFTCRQQSLENLHFDTAHYSHLVWADPAELREKLKNRILAVIGQGPVAKNPA